MKRSRLSAITAFATGLAAITSASAQAETLTVGGHLPATTDVGLDVETIAVDDLSGGMGARLSYELKNALERTRVEDQNWFEIVPLGAEPVDAIIQGSAGIQSSVLQLEPKRERECVEKDKDKKCVRYRTNVYECTRTEVSFFPDIEIVGREGEILYTARNELNRNEDVCADTGSPPSVSAMSDALVSNFAWRVRNALAPRFLSREYRVLERRKGLEKADRKAFKEALRLTKTDENAACEAFQALEAANPQHVSVLFNVAMCQERDGNYETSLATLERALAVEPKKLMALESVDRVQSWIRGEDQLIARAEIMGARYPDFAALPDTSGGGEGQAEGTQEE